MTDTLFIHQDGSTQTFSESQTIAANLYAIVYAKGIRAIHRGMEKIVYKDGNPVAVVECSRAQVLESI